MPNTLIPHASVCRESEDPFCRDPSSAKSLGMPPEECFDEKVVPQKPTIILVVGRTLVGEGVYGKQQIDIPFSKPTPYSLSKHSFADELLSECERCLSETQPSTSAGKRRSAHLFHVGATKNKQKTDRLGSFWAPFPFVAALDLTLHPRSGGCCSVSPPSLHTSYTAVFAVQRLSHRACKRAEGIMGRKLRCDIAALFGFSPLATAVSFTQTLCTRGLN